jgi:hypothetical protein
MTKKRANYEPCLSDFPIGCEERWRAIREFTRRWHRVALPDVGGQQSKIKKVENKLGYALPVSCREWIAFVGDLINAKSFETVLRDSLSFCDLKDLAAVSLLIQGEGDYHWAVRKEDLTSEDPPVQGYRLDYDSTIMPLPFAHHQLWASSVSTWALGFILSYLYISSENFGTSVDDAGLLVRQLEEYFPAKLELEKVRVFEARNVIVVLTSDWFSPGDYLSVYVWKAIPRREIPDFLWALMKDGGAFSGMFANE